MVEKCHPLVGCSGRAIRQDCGEIYGADMLSSMAMNTRRLLVTAATLSAAFLLTGCSSPEPVTDSQEAAQPAEAQELTTADVEVLDLSTDDRKFVSVNFPVEDAMTNSGVVSSLQEGCVVAILAAKEKTDSWYDYNTIQCMGSINGEHHVGSANFSGAALSEISDQHMKDDPAAFWESAESSSIAPAYN